VHIGQHFLFPGSRWLQPIPLLARLAGETDENVKLVTQIVLAPLYHPVLLAEELATLDIVSGGPPADRPRRRLPAARVRNIRRALRRTGGPLRGVPRANADALGERLRRLRRDVLAAATARRRTSARGAAAEPRRSGSAGRRSRASAGRPGLGDTWVLTPHVTEPGCRRSSRSTREYASSSASLSDDTRCRDTSSSTATATLHEIARSLSRRSGTPGWVARDAEHQTLDSVQEADGRGRRQPLHPRHRSTTARSNCATLVDRFPRRPDHRPATVAVDDRRTRRWPTWTGSARS